MKEKTKKAFKKPLWYVWLPIAAVLLAIAIVADVLCQQYWYVIYAAFADTESVTNHKLMDEAITESRELNATLLEEGSVLLKNDNGVLPLDKGNVNVYGIISANMYLNGNGSSANGNTNSVTIKTALESEGFTVNPQLWNLLVEKSGNSGGSNSNVNEGSIKDDKVTEIDLDTYDKTVSWSAAKDYSEYAIVTFGRVGGEGSDLGTTYLELGDSEIALLKKLKEKFKVITLINSSHVLEMGPINEYSDAVLWIGGPGMTGTNGVARILSGAVSPSGRLVDTWIYNQEDSSTYYTARTYNYSGASGGYTNYNEGIYVGYRWYETADYEGYWDAKYTNGYSDVVAYPFGYGLSYGELSEEIISAEESNGVITFEVRVSNANSVATKHVAQIYVEKPYTEGGVEVPKVELVGFAKSKALKDGETDTLTITVNVEDLASYDSAADNGNGAYVLLGGNYKFYLAGNETGAHIWKTADAQHSWSKSFAQSVYSGDNKRESDAVAASNRLGANGNNSLAIDDDNAGFKALSRANHFANAEQTIGSSSQKNNIAANAEMKKLLTDYLDFGTYQGEILDNLKTGQKKKYSFADLYTTDANGNPLYKAEYDEEGNLVSKTVLGTVDYDDPRWDYLISQMTVDELEKLITKGGWMTAKIDSIDKLLGADYDGPFGLSNFMKASLGQSSQSTSFCSEPVTASTWNVELLEELGKAVGKEANAFGQSGWYAPGANIHRTPFGGRNAEYFSEDPFISGQMCMYESRGALSAGLYCVAKHFAFNDTEANRTSKQNCWMSEQTAREIYLKPYELGCKSGDVLGLMASYMWINGEWLGGDYSLMTGIVRNEWGFKGLITTDNQGQGGGYDWMTASKVVYAGGDLVLANTSKVKLDNSIKTTDAGISAMKTSAKHILYTIATAYLNRQEAARVGANKFVPYFVLGNVVLYGGALAMIGVYVTKLTLYLCKKKGTNQDDLPEAAPIEPTPDSEKPDSV